MSEAKSYFFSGIGGSGMMPLAMIVRAQGARVAGSDRMLDQGRLGSKFEFLQSQGIALFPQDGSGVAEGQIFVATAAIEDHVPDMVKAKALGLQRMSRAELLAELFNAAANSIAVGGTSGKSTVTGMIGWILHATGRDPTVMNGAVMKNFASPDAPFASALVGQGDVFVSEVDESDGSIVFYRPKVAVLNNITLDHKSLEELRHLFRDFALEAETVVLNLDDDETRLLAATLPPEKLITYSSTDDSADFYNPGGLDHTGLDGSDFVIRPPGTKVHERVFLRLPGLHNAQNALAAIAAAYAVGVAPADAARALRDFAGLRRRFEIVGEAHGVTVIDDFAHNPDKIAATLGTLNAQYDRGRLLLFFQPHGFGPLRTMRRELADTFADEMAADDVLIMPDPVYYGGTTDKSVGTGDLIADIVARGRHAEHIPERAACGERLVALARPGDRIVVMGARDDTLTLFAEDILGKLG